MIVCDIKLNRSRGRIRVRIRLFVPFFLEKLLWLIYLFIYFFTWRPAYFFLFYYLNVVFYSCWILGFLHFFIFFI